MLIAGSALKNYAIAARDGAIGTVKDFLFDDATWKIRWLVVDTGHWLPGRQVLIHPSAMETPDHERQRLPVNLTKAQVEASPDILRDQPVSMQMQQHLFDYYGWDPSWGPSFYGGDITGFGAFGSPYGRGVGVLEANPMDIDYDDGDPHLRSMSAIHGYHIHATDGVIGHVENILLDDANWAIRYVVVDTRNWWPGAHVLISPCAVQAIEWTDHEVRLNVSRTLVKTSPPWDPADMIEREYERSLHDHYGWLGPNW